MDVTDVLRDRASQPEGLQITIAASILLHAALAALLILAPDDWLPSRTAESRSIMTITLGGGTPGPANTGMTPLSSRPVQSAIPMEAPSREPLRPPAARTPEMTIPREDTPPRRPPKPTPQVTQAPPEARGTTPSRGAETSPGQGIAETGARGGGFGLASGGGSGGTGARLDVANFCCPEYITTMAERVRSNWVARSEVAAQVEVKFTIQRSGRITDIAIERSSGYQALDFNAQRALVTTAQLPPLPTAFPNPTLTVYLTFEYTR
jgi:TonB family protein